MFFIASSYIPMKFRIQFPMLADRLNDMLRRPTQYKVAVNYNEFKLLEFRILWEDINAPAANQDRGQSIARWKKMGTRWYFFMAGRW